MPTENLAKKLMQHDYDELKKAIGEPVLDDLKETLEKGKTENEMLQHISDQLTALNNKLNYIFGEHVLISGAFKIIK